MSEIEAAVFGRFLPIKCPDEKVNIRILASSSTMHLLNKCSIDETVMMWASYEIAWTYA